MPYLGQLAAIGTSLAFSVGSTLFTLAGRTLGTGIVNRVRLALALIFTMLLHLLLVGTLYPVNASPGAFFWMGLSGLVGFVIGDALLFQGFVMVGPRLSMLMMATAPVLSAIMAWLFLNEALGLRDVIGIVVTMIGIGLVVAQPPPTTKGAADSTGAADVAKKAEDQRTYMIGLLFAFGGAVGQAGGSLLSKIGLSDGLTAISGNAIRLTAAMICIWLWAVLRRQLAPTWQGVRKYPRAVSFVVLATIAGPVIGVWLALVSVQLAPLGVVTTLQSLPPIFLIPIGYFVFKERITRFAVLGTLVALIGSVILFLR